jgi:uncharacterized protein (DUF1697 family)
MARYAAFLRSVRIEAINPEHLGQAFMTIVRTEDALQRILGADPYKAFRHGLEAKRIVTFLRTAPRSPAPTFRIPAGRLERLP